jgi:lysozyme
MSDASNRTVIAALVLSACGLVGIALDEGYTQKAVPDAVKGHTVPTLGFGSTEGVKMGDVTTPQVALARTMLEAQGFESAIKRCVRVPLFQHEYDAYVNLAYNIGPSAFCGSQIVKRLNALDYAGACDAILNWRKVGNVDCSLPGNKSCRGLWERRQRTRTQCLGQSSGGQP